MDPISVAILAAITIYNIAVVITYFLLTLQEVLNWFRHRSNLVTRDRDNLAFSIQDLLSQGQYKTIQGVFNTRRNDIIDSRLIKSQKVDQALGNAHSNNRLVIYS